MLISVSFSGRVPSRFLSLAKTITTTNSKIMISRYADIFSSVKASVELLYNIEAKADIINRKC